MKRVFLWSTVDRLGQQSMQLLFGIVLARLLTPADFGLMSMVLFLIGIAYVFVDGGNGQALARTQHPTDDHYATVLWSNLAFSLLLYLLLYALAPVLALFFRQPLLTPIIRVLFLSLLFNAGYLVQHTRLCMQLRFRSVAWVNLWATLLSGLVAIYWAWRQGGVWALVAQQVSYQALRLLFFWMAVPMPVKGHFNKQIFCELFPFARHICGIALMNAVFNNLYLFVVGKFALLQQAGQYTQAQRQTDTISFTFLAILNHSTYNVFAKLQRKPVRLRQTLHQFIQRFIPLTTLLLLLLAVWAEPIVRVLMGEQWLPCVPYLQLLCLAAIPAPLSLLYQNALNACGYTRTTLRIELFKKSIIALAVVLYLFYAPLQWSIPALLWFSVASAWSGLILYMYETARKI